MGAPGTGAAPGPGHLALTFRLRVGVRVSASNRDSSEIFESSCGTLGSSEIQAVTVLRDTSRRLAGTVTVIISAGAAGWPAGRRGPAPAPAAAPDSDTVTGPWQPAAGACLRLKCPRRRNETFEGQKPPTPNLVGTLLTWTLT